MKNYGITLTRGNYKTSGWQRRNICQNWLILRFPTSLFHSSRDFWEGVEIGDRINIPILWYIGNLKKTYIGDHQMQMVHTSELRCKTSALNHTLESYIGLEMYCKFISCFDNCLLAKVVYSILVIELFSILNRLDQDLVGRI